jgi:hypothetical protein
MDALNAWLPETGWLRFLTVAGFWLLVISAVVWLTGRASVLTRSIVVIKTVHTVAFVLLSALLLVFLYDVAVDRTTALTWTAIALFCAEGVILVVNGGRCPLTTYAERLGSPHGQITDLFLPKWFADRVFKFYTVAFVAALVVFGLRLAV